MDYMQNQMDNLIEASRHHYEEFVKETDERIAKFIKDNGYTWTVEGIVKEYIEKYSKGDYVSFSAKKIIEKFKYELEKTTGIISKNNDHEQ